VKLLKKNPRKLVAGSTALVEIKTQNPICIELYSDYKQLGRFSLRQNDLTIAAGVITALKPSKKLSS